MNYNDFNCDVSITTSFPSAFAGGKFILYRVENSNVDMSVKTRIPKTNDLESSVGVRIVDEFVLNAKVDIKYGGTSSIDLDLNVMMLNSIDCEVKITESAYATGIFELIEPPVFTAELNPQKDAMTRSYPKYRPYNFGQEMTMLIGKGEYSGTEELYDSFLRFDLESFKYNKIIKGARLRLYYVDVIDELDNIDLHEIATDFSELGVNFYNKPEILNELTSTFTIDKKKKFIEFDVTEIITNICHDNMKNNGFGLTSKDDKKYTFYTKESPRKPVLFVDHIDLSFIASFGRSHMDADVFVLGVGRSEVNMEMEVKSYFSMEDVDMDVYVHRYEDPVFNDVDAYVVINNPQLTADVKIVVVGENDVDSDVTIVQSDWSFIDSDVKISIPILDSIVEVKYTSDIDSDVVIRAIAYSDIDAKLILSTPDLNATIVIPYHGDSNVDLDTSIRGLHEDYFDIEVEIKGLVYEDLDAMLGVSVPSIDVETTIRAIAYSDVDSDTHVRGLYFDDVNIEVRIKNDNLHSEVDIVHSSRIDAFVDVICVSNLDLEVDVIHASHIDAFADVICVSNLDLEVDVIHASQIDAFVDVVKTSVLDSEVDIVCVSNIDSEVIISIPTLDAYFKIPYFGEADCDMTFRPRVRGIDDLSVEVQINGAFNGAYGFIM